MDGAARTGPSRKCDRQTARYRPAQTATNGSRILPRVLNPAPFSFWAGVETRHTNRSQKAGDVPRFWLGRSVARRLPGHATTTEAERAIPAEAKNFRCLR